MKKLSEDGSVLWPHEYCIVNDIKPIIKEDCYCEINGDASSVTEYFYNNFTASQLLTPFENFNVWKSFCYDSDSCDTIINGNQTLREINKILKISKCMIMSVSPNSFVNWHHDYPVKGPVLNLLLTPHHRSHSLFTYNIPDTYNLIECLYKQNTFFLYNTDIIHSILNFEETRYVFSAIFEQGEAEELDWKTVKELLKDFLC